MSFHYTIDPLPDELLRNIKTDITGARKAGMISAVTGIEALAVKKVPVKVGNLLRTRTAEVSPDGSQGEISFTSPYAEYVHEGTGLFGPHHARIIPKTAKALFWPGASHPVRSVAGMKGRPFLTDAAEEADLGALYSEGVRAYLAKQGGAK